MNENIFIDQLKKGDRVSLNVFVKEHQNMVYRTCLGYLQNEHDAADLTQNVFLKALEKIQQFNGDSKLSTWLTRIAINLSINYLRDNKKRLGHSDIEQVSLAEDESRDVELRQTKHAVRLAIFGLAKKQRKVFILHFYLKLSAIEINEITGLSTSSIESLLFRARKNLKDSLKEYYLENILNASFL